jgi:hypothetical protein
MSRAIDLCSFEPVAVELRLAFAEHDEIQQSLGVGIDQLDNFPLHRREEWRKLARPQLLRRGCGHIGCGQQGRPSPAIQPQGQRRNRGQGPAEDDMKPPSGFLSLISGFIVRTAGKLIRPPPGAFRRGSIA